MSVESLPKPARVLIAALGLQPLDREGGYFRRTFEAPLWVQPANSEAGAAASRAYSVIYALFTETSFSAMHVLAKDEIWCWHGGDALESLRLHADGRGEWVRLGLDVAGGQRPQDVIEAGVWQGTRLVPGGQWALVSCVVVPEFAWEDFELAECDTLVAKYPNFRDGIVALTRDEPPVGKR